MPASTNQPKPAAVILAAGMSRRMGSPKALLDLDGKPLILRVVGTLLQVPSLSSIIVVTGHQPHAIHEALTGQDVTFIHNSDFEAGEMLSSVKVGAAAVSGLSDAFFLVLMDQPLVLPRTLELMWKAWQANRPPLLAPSYQGKRGHPILIESASVPQVLSLASNATLRDFVERHRGQMTVVEVNDAGVVFNLDTPEDYQAMLKLWETRSRPSGKP